jgi:deaminated glutathione amidase
MPITIHNKPTRPAQTALSTFKIAGIQMASSPHVPSNLTEAERLIALAAQQGVT